MGGAALSLALTAAIAGPHAVTLLGHARISGDRVALGEIADLSPLPPSLRGPASRLLITIAPTGRHALALSAAEVTERARALMPALSPWLPTAAGKIDVDLEPETPRQAPRSVPCLAVKAPLAAGAEVAAADFAPALCEQAPQSHAFRYDAANGTMRAARDLATDERLAAPPSGDMAAVLPGDAVYIHTTIGHVAVARRVEAVEPAAAGRAVFVKADDGDVFSVPAPETSP
ncbi:MAG TPA: hypothetical protein VGI95_21965 [Caulobacteraceae bacterium]|jgi:hypothetical protein